MKRSRKYTAAGPREFQPAAGLPPRGDLKTRWLPCTLPESRRLPALTLEYLATMPDDDPRLKSKSDTRELKFRHSRPN